MLSLYEILKASKTGIASDMWTALAGMNWGGKDSGAEVKELTGIPPLSFTADGTPLLDYLISGNMTQSGTPTPTTPIQPQECGEMTRNLANLYGVDKTALSLNFKTGDNMTIAINGTKGSGANVISIAYPNITLPAGTYTVRIKMIGGTISNITGGAVFGINASVYSMRTTPQINKVGDIGIRTFTLTEDTLLSSLDIAPSYDDVGSVWDNATFECWLYSGSDDIPYEPYGYKIPISSANTTTPIYLGEVQSTRQIYKLVLTGQEDFSNPYGTSLFSLLITPLGKTGYNNAYCTHYNYNPVQSGLNANTENGEFALQLQSTQTLLAFKDTSYTSPTDFKTYLQQQYAAGTPVCVWYVLATEETGIVNEPLRKIGDYADTVSYEQAGVQIPTNRGNTVIDVETELKPSQMYIKYQE